MVSKTKVLIMAAANNEGRLTISGSMRKNLPYKWMNAAVTRLPAWCGQTRVLARAR